MLPSGRGGGTLHEMVCVGGGGGGGMGLQPHPPISAHGVLYSPTIMYVTDL